MKIADVIAHAKQLLQDLDRQPSKEYAAALAGTPELLRMCPGPESDLLRQVVEARGGMAHGIKAKAALTALVQMHDAGLLTELSLQRRAQSDVLADIFDQADVILDGNDFHPAAAAVLIGGALEQFLRAWAEEKCSEALGTKRSIDAYATALRGANLIDKSAKKDIDAWAGLRNEAAHGELEKVSRERVRIMKDGVKLFMRQFGAKV